MRNRTLWGAIAVAAIGLAGGWWAGGIPGLVAGGFFGLASAYAVAELDVRTGVAIPVVAGTLLGAVIGRSIVRAICLPDACVGFEISAALATAIGAFVGVGLVVALVTRSFDEYRSAVDAGRPPPEPGCEAEPADEAGGPAAPRVADS